MKTIKFRGKTRGGDIFFGDLIHRFGMVAIGTDGNFQEVEPETVEQLVGHDADGTEIYEGDAVVVDGGGTCYATVLKFLKTEKNSNLDFDDCAKEYGWKLKTPVD